MTHGRIGPTLTLTSLSLTIGACGARSELVGPPGSMPADAATLEASAVDALDRSDDAAPDRIVEITAGVSICARYASGSVRCWDHSTGHEGRAIDALHGAIALTSGWEHHCALLGDGTVRCWGSGEKGQLGFGIEADGWDESTYPTPRPVPGVSDVRQLASSNWANCALEGNGDVVCWGTWARDTASDLYPLPSDPVLPDSPTFPPTVLLHEPDAVEVAVGQGVCFRRIDGTAGCWARGAIGDGVWHSDFVGPVDVAGVSAAVRITAGDDYVCAIRDDGAVLCWGNPGVGYTDTTLLTPTPIALAGPSTDVRIGGLHECALQTVGSVICWGQSQDNNFGSCVARYPPTTVCGLHGAAAIAVGMAGGCALLTDGRLACWGEPDSVPTIAASIVVGSADAGP